MDQASRAYGRATFMPRQRWNVLNAQTRNRYRLAAFQPRSIFPESCRFTRVAMDCRSTARTGQQRPLDGNAGAFDAGSGSVVPDAVGQPSPPFAFSDAAFPGALPPMVQNPPGPVKRWSLHIMEETGGEPDVVSECKKTGEYIFVDCSAQTPVGRVSLCYDDEALESRKEHSQRTAQSAWRRRWASSSRVRW